VVTVQKRRIRSRYNGAFKGVVEPLGGCGGFPDLKVLGKEILLGDDTNQLKVGLRDAIV
jgi:hypothetical protein